MKKHGESSGCEVKGSALNGAVTFRRQRVMVY